MGYRWLARTGAKPLYAFGHGLTYTSFTYGDFAVTGGETVSLSFKVTNTGHCDGADVPQVYLIEVPGERCKRLLGFERAELRPGESQRVEIAADPRLLARFDATDGRWHIAEGTYRLALARSAEDIVLTADAHLSAQSFELRAPRRQDRTVTSAATRRRRLSEQDIVY